MNIAIIIVIVLLLCVAGFYYFKKAQGKLSNYTPKEVYERIKAGKQVVLLDVRAGYERKKAYLDNSIHIPMQEIDSKLEELNGNKDKEIIVYCAVGGRSVVVAAHLQKLGYKVGNMTGGIKRWINEELEYKSG